MLLLLVLWVLLTSRGLQADMYGQPARTLDMLARRQSQPSVQEGTATTMMVNAQKSTMPSIT